LTSASSLHLANGTAALRGQHLTPFQFQTAKIPRDETDLEAVQLAHGRLYQAKVSAIGPAVVKDRGMG
jgi:hypothetical protein